ncbi:hypothetical protein M0R04_08265 [Candidatus Dojkabacteria bacterium]|jgi:hypothetical protein|nr:hypothetical protein [Candidatus Dojkabacteria bacterium]
MKLTVLQKASIQRAIERISYLQDGISADGDFELEGMAYDKASLALVEAIHWLALVIKDCDEA